MGKQEAPFIMLEQFLPEGTYKKVASFFREYDIHLSITHDRITILGDYRTPHQRLSGPQDQY
jgi:SprT protein